MAKREMKLGLFIRPCGHHIASWRHPRAQADAGVNFPHFVEMAKTAERGLFDMLFSADSLTAWTASESAIDRVHYVAWLEPFTLLSALSGYTRNIGLVCTASTSFEQPYSIARRFATLDIISGGRAGWNVVTSGNETEAQNFSKEPHLPKRERYKRAREFTDVVQRPLGLLGRGRLPARQRDRHLLRSREDARARSPRPVLRRARPAQRCAHPARSSGHRAGRSVRRRSSARRRDCRGRLCGP